MHTSVGMLCAVWVGGRGVPDPGPKKISASPVALFPFEVLVHFLGVPADADRVLGGDLKGVNTAPWDAIHTRARTPTHSPPTHPMPGGGSQGPILRSNCGVQKFGDSCRK